MSLAIKVLISPQAYHQRGPWRVATIRPGSRVLAAARAKMPTRALAHGAHGDLEVVAFVLQHMRHDFGVRFGAERMTLGLGALLLSSSNFR